MSAAEIMIVEDESIVAFDIEHCLKNLGYTVPAISASGEEALEKAKEVKPDLILMDIMLSGEVDGVEVAGRLQGFHSIPIIYLTAFTDEKTLRRAKVTEPYGYVLKPFEEVQLKTTIEMALYKHQKAKLLENAGKRNEAAAVKLNDGLWDWDASDNSFFVSAGCEKLLNLEVSELNENPDSLLKSVHEEDLESVKKGFDQLINGQSYHLEQEFRVVQPDESHIWVKSKLMAVRDKEGHLLHLIGSLNDISVRKTAEDVLIHYSFNDPLTDLPNRVSFLDHLGRKLRQTVWQKKCHFVLIHLNIDNFKEINQAYGYQGGDQLLSLVGARLREKVSKKALVSRLGADNFVILQDLRSGQAIDKILDRIIEIFTIEFDLQGQAIPISVSLGAVANQNRFTFPEEMLLEAEKAMYMAKDTAGFSYFVA